MTSRRPSTISIDEACSSGSKLVYSIPEHANPTGCLAGGSRRRSPSSRLVKAGRSTIGSSCSKTPPIGASPSTKSSPRASGGSTPKERRSSTPELSAKLTARAQDGIRHLAEGTGRADLGPQGKPRLRNVESQSEDPRAGCPADGKYEKQIETLVGVYRKKRDVFVSAIDEYFDRLRPSDLDTAQRGALRLDVGPSGCRYRFQRASFPALPGGRGDLCPGRIYLCPGTGPGAEESMRLSFGVPEEAKLVEGARLLAWPRRSRHVWIRSAKRSTREGARRERSSRSGKCSRLTWGQGRELGRPSSWVFFSATSWAR